MSYHNLSSTLELLEPPRIPSRPFANGIGQLAYLPLPVLVNRCQEETTRYSRMQISDDRFCYELFRRAVVEKSQPAWDALYQNYHAQVLRMLQKGNRLAQIDENPDALVNETFAKFAHAVTTEKFAKFPELRSILCYLKLCAGSVVLDHLRKHDLKKQELAPNLPASEPLPHERVEQTEWVAQIMLRLKDEDEMLVFRALFILAMKPREICLEWPQRFQSIQQIYQIRQNIIERFKRDKALKRYYTL